MEAEEARCVLAQEKLSRQPVTIYLEDIANKLDETMDHWEQYLNVFTGEFESIPDGIYLDADEELTERIGGSTDYVRLPNQYDIHEFRIMEQFAEATPDRRKQTELFQALHGKRPFRHFKDELNYYGLREDYYAFRFLAFIEIARDWCENFGIPYRMKKM